MVRINPYPALTKGHGSGEWGASLSQADTSRAILSGRHSGESLRVAGAPYRLRAGAANNSVVLERCYEREAIRWASLANVVAGSCWLRQRACAGFDQIPRFRELRGVSRRRSDHRRHRDWRHLRGPQPIPHSDRSQSGADGSVVSSHSAISRSGHVPDRLRVT